MNQNIKLWVYAEVVHGHIAASRAVEGDRARRRHR